MTTLKTLALLAAVLASAAVAQEGADAKAAAPTPAPAAKPPPDVSLMPFTPDSIKQVVAYHQEKIQACYEETLAGKQKPVEGKLLTTFVITGEGLVKKARVEKKGTSLKEPKLHECVVAALTAMTFPKPPDSKDHPVEYPFNLKAVH